MVIKGEAVADIGADHALLSIYLLEENLAPSVIIGELGDGPYERALQAVSHCNVKEKIEVRQGDGLQILEPGEVSSIVIAGMGGNTISDILAYDWKKAASFKYYVFQPMSKAGVLRKALAEQGWPIIEERLLYENGHYYVLICSKPGFKPYELDDLEIDIGPLILKGDKRIKNEFLKIYQAKYNNIYKNLVYSGNNNKLILIEEYKNKIKRLEALIDADQS